MTATIHRIYTAPPPIVAADWETMLANHDADVVAALRAEWSANRAAQRKAGVGVYAPLPAPRLRLRYIAAFIAALAIGQIAVDAMTASNAARLDAGLASEITPEALHP